MRFTACIFYHAGTDKTIDFVTESEVEARMDTLYKIEI